MSSFFNLLSDGYVNFKKCGDVVVSPEDNMIGMFCHFCCDIYTNLPEFLHHLQWMHNDVLAFANAHNVYSVEELLAPKAAQEYAQSQADSSSSSDSGIPAENAIEATCVDEFEPKTSIGMNQNILNALAAYDVDYKKTKTSCKTATSKNVLQWQAEADKCLPEAKAAESDVLAEVEAMLLEDDSPADLTQPLMEDPTNHGMELPDMLKAAGLTDIELNEEQSMAEHLDDKQVPVDIIETSIRSTYSIVPNSKRAKVKPEKAKPTCDLKSYTIARSARRREQLQSLRNIKKRIALSLEGETHKPERLPLKEASLQQLKGLTVSKIKHEKPTAKSNTTEHQLYFAAEENISVKPSIKQEKENDTLELELSLNPSNNTTATASKINNAQGCKKELMNLSETQPKASDYSSANAKSTIKSAQKVKPIKSPIIINNVALLPKLNLNFEKVESNVETNGNTIQKTIKRRSSNCNSQETPFKKDPLKLSTQQNNHKQAINKTAASTTAVEPKRAKTEPNARASPDFDLSDSVVEFLQSDLKTTQLDGDSLLQLAEPSSSDSYECILNQVTTQKKQDVKEPEAQLDEANESGIKADVQHVRNDLTLLRVVSLPIIKDEHCEDVKPVVFTDVMRSKAKKFAQMLRTYDTVWNPKRINAQKIIKELALLTEEVNAALNTNLNVSEVKRILNLINAWHAQQIDLKFFKKVSLSDTVEHHLQLFAFLPKINRCVYYCEWCEESSSNKTRYEKHRLTHLTKFTCSHCKRGFKKQGHMLNHMRIMHSQEQ